MHAHAPMKRQGAALILACSLLSFSALAQETPTIVIVEGAAFDTQLVIDGRSFELIGSGLFTYMIWDAYAGAYYQASGFSRPAPLGDVPRHLVLEYFHAIDAEDFAETTRQSVMQHADDKRPEALSRELQAFNESYRDVVPGDRYALTWTGDELRLSYNGEVIYESDDQALASALFAIWLGDEPAQEAFKRDLLGKSR